MILVDSSVWIDYFNGTITPETDLLHQCLAQMPVLVGHLMLAEVLQGYDSDKDFNHAQHLLTSLRTVPLVNTRQAIRAAQHFRALRRRGITIRKTVDTLIATYCITHRLPLLYSDRDFDPFVEYLALTSAMQIDSG